MKIIQVDPDDHYRTQQFLELPFRIYRNSEFWVPPLETDSKLIFDLKRNPFYKHSQSAFFMAIARDGSALGRLAVLNNRNYNLFNHTQTAFFCLFECVNEPQAARAMFSAGYEWSIQQGLTIMIGPKGFSALDGMGLLVKGFEHRPAFGISYHHPYYSELIESAGFTKQSDIVSGYLNPVVKLPEKITHVTELVQQRRGLKIARFRTKHELRRAIPAIRDLYNKMLQGTSGNVPLTEGEVKAIENSLIWFADPHLIKVIEKDGTMVGFLFAYPDISAAIQRTKGKLYPFGWLSMLSEMRGTDWININGAGIIEQYQGMGGTAILFNEMHKSVASGGFKHAELVQIGVDNDKMQRELKELGVDFYKTHRIYQRGLAEN